MTHDEDHITLAAEYVLGTLDGDERVQVETMMTIDQDFRALVESWERRLGELNAMVASVEPPEHVWGKVREAVTAIAPATALRLPEISAPTPVAPLGPIEPQPAGGAEIVQLNSRLRRIRGWAQAATALAACLVAFVLAQVAAPSLLPQSLRPGGSTAAPQRALVAVLSRDGGPPAFVMTVDPASKTLTVRRPGADPEGAKSYELWMVSDKLARPRSLGVIGKDDFTTKAVLTSFDDATIDGATYAITLEPQGGSPTGQPTSAPLFAGKLMDIVPPPGAQKKS